jgi:ABC-type nitrate/sulfonate/bicarbonate transport system substrate-binding protein
MSAKAAALDAHRLDAAIIGEPFLSAALAAKQARVLAAPLSAIAPRFIQSTWFGSADWVRTHADLARRFAQTITAANTYANGHHAEIAPLVAAFVHVPVETVEQTAAGTLGTTLTAADVQPVIDVALKYHMIQHPIAVADLFGLPAAR